MSKGYEANINEIGKASTYKGDNTNVDNLGAMEVEVGVKFEDVVKIREEAVSAG